MKKQFVSSLLSLLLTVSLIFSGCSFGEDDENTTTVTTSEEEDCFSETDWLGSGNGVEFQLTTAPTSSFEMEEAGILLRNMGITSVSVTLPMETLMNRDRSGSADEKKISTWFDLFLRSGVKTILVTVKGGFWPEEYSYVTDASAFPYPESGEDKTSPYYAYLLRYGEDIAHLAKTYPQVTVWQTGTGMEQTSGAHPYSARSGSDFTLEERTKIALDLAVSAKQTLKKEKQTAKIMPCGFSLTEDGTVSDYMQYFYRYLSSGTSPLGVTKAEQCYDAVNWIPALCWSDYQDDDELSALQTVRNAMTKAGDESPVFLTGIVFDDYGSANRDAEQATVLQKWAEVTRTLSFIKGIYPGVFVEYDSDTQGKGLTKKEESGALTVKSKGLVLCRLYGGETESLKQSEDTKLVNETMKLSMESKNGICFPIKGAADERFLNVESIMNLLEVMNVKCMRNWMNVRTLLTNPTTLNQTEVKKQKNWIAMLNARGIYKIIGMNQGSFWLTGNNTDECAVPYPDYTEGSDYLKFLEDYKTSWKTLASAFPEITYWEMGNERNHDPFLHPADYSTKGTKFTINEKAQITVDMAYYANLGIKEANSDAVAIFPGLAATSGFSSLATFLEKCYTYIESGKAPGGTDPDAYFDAVAWHFYYLQKSVTFTPQNWKDGNDSVHQVMVNHGDSEKKVFLTEFGFSDAGSQTKDAEQAEYFRQIYALLDEMPYLDSLYPFRTVEDQTAASWGGTVEIYYGMFRVFDTEHFGAKEKAKAICQIYGGDLTKLDLYIGNNKVYD